MNEWIGFLAVIVAVIGVGVSLKGDFRKLRGDITELRERMARLEGLLEGFTKREA